jgi:hypothetical protein
MDVYGQLVSSGSTEYRGDMLMDDRMLGSLTVYRQLLREHVFAPRLPSGHIDSRYKLSSFGHGLAGMAAGWTVSFIAAPVEHVAADSIRGRQVETSLHRAYRLLEEDPEQVRHKRSIPWSWLDTSLPDILLRMVEYLRHLFTLVRYAHVFEHARYQFLGGRIECADVLDHELP